MTINIFVLKGDLNGKIVVVRFFFCWVYMAQKEGNSILVRVEKLLHLSICIPNIIKISQLKRTHFHL